MVVFHKRLMLPIREADIGDFGLTVKKKKVATEVKKAKPKKS
jgi:hypothetical protein